MILIYKEGLIAETVNSFSVECVKYELNPKEANKVYNNIMSKTYNYGSTAKAEISATSERNRIVKIETEYHLEVNNKLIFKSKLIQDCINLFDKISDGLRSSLETLDI